MIHTKDVHQQFADYFNREPLNPYLYLLSKKLSEGHICIDLRKIDPEELKAVGYEYVMGEEVLEKEELVSDGSTWKPFVLWKNKFYLQRYFHYESLVFTRIKSLIEKEPAFNSNFRKELINQKEWVGKLFASGNFVKGVDWQLVAAIMAVTHQFTIITGGPGTGKTTTVVKILSLLFRFNPELRVALAAPTGKAAARMAESLKNASRSDAIFEPDLKTMQLFENLEPSTIHRLLKYRPGSIYFKHNRDNPVPHDLVIIDESSMIDLALFAKLMDAVGTKTKVIFLGDKDQLASVEAGSLFGDLCIASAPLNQFSSDTARFINQFIENTDGQIEAKNIRDNKHLLFEHVIELQYSHRFSDEEGIGKLSKAIIQNKQADIKHFFINKDDRISIDTQYTDVFFYRFVSGFREYIEEPDIKTAFSKLNKLRVLCAVKEGPEGLYALNNKIERFLQNQKWIQAGSEFYEHRPVIVTGNNYELGLFNGDVGIVRKDEKGHLKVWFEGADGNLKAILPAFVDSAETVFAMTIHKSQGSEFDKVMIVLPENPDLPLMTRELLYTAVTRAKAQVFIQCTEESILSCTQKQVERGSGIIDRF